MKCILLNRKTLKNTVAFDTDSATIEKSEIAGNVNGVFDIESSMPIALYAEEGELYFQVGKQRWNIKNDGLEFHHSSNPLTLNLLHKFWVTNKHGEIIYRKKYFDPYWKNFKNLIDWTYDELDREMDDIYLWFARDCNKESWREEFAFKWTHGISISSS